MNFRIEDFSDTPYMDAFLNQGLSGFIAALEVQLPANSHEFRSVLFFSFHCYGLSPDTVCVKGSCTKESLKKYRAGIREPSPAMRRKITAKLTVALITHYRNLRSLSES